MTPLLEIYIIIANNDNIISKTDNVNGQASGFCSPRRGQSIMGILEQVIRLYSTEPLAEFSIRQISKKLTKSYSYTYNKIQDGISNGILRSKKRGASTSCSLNLESQKTLELLSAISVSDKDAFAKKQCVLSSALDELAVKVKEKSNYNIFAMILFGSTAKGTARKKSDIDLFFISPSKEKYDEMIENECNAIRMSYGREVNPIVAEPKMYINMLREKEENVGKQVLRNKVIFFGANKFWDLTMEGLK